MNCKSEQIYKITLIFACLFTLNALNFALVFAQEADVTNQQTGSGSVNQAEYSSSQATDIQSVNQGQTVNEINLNLNTGQNQSSQNQAGTDLNSGDINTAVTLATVSNQNQVDLSAYPTGPLYPAQEVSNQQTGADSNNQALLNSTQQTTLNLNNHQTITSQIIVNANTGHNQANGNGSLVNLTTGEVQIAIEQFTAGNQNLVKGTPCGYCFVNTSSLINQFTGAGSTNLAQANLNNTISVYQHNQSQIFNNFNIFADTGYNQADDNLGPVTIDTGSINIGVTVETLANLNEVVWSAPKGPVDPGDDVEIGGPDDDQDQTPSSEGNQPATSTGNASSSSGSSGSSSGGNSPAIGGSVLGDMLPATGSPYTLTMWMIGLFLISMGRFVRLTSGRSPALVKA